MQIPMTHESWISRHYVGEHESFDQPCCYIPLYAIIIPIKVSSTAPHAAWCPNLTGRHVKCHAMAQDLANRKKNRRAVPNLDWFKGTSAGNGHIFSMVKTSQM